MSGAVQLLQSARIDCVVLEGPCDCGLCELARLTEEYGGYDGPTQPLTQPSEATLGAGLTKPSK